MEREAKASALKSIKPPESPLSIQRIRKRKLDRSMRGNTLEGSSLMSLSPMGEKSIELPIKKDGIDIDTARLAGST